MKHVWGGTIGWIAVPAFLTISWDAAAGTEPAMADGVESRVAIQPAHALESDAAKALRNPQHCPPAALHAPVAVAEPGSEHPP